MGAPGRTAEINAANASGRYLKVRRKPVNQKVRHDNTSRSRMQRAARMSPTPNYTSMIRAVPSCRIFRSPRHPFVDVRGLPWPVVPWAAAARVTEPA